MCRAPAVGQVLTLRLLLGLLLRLRLKVLP